MLHKYAITLLGYLATLTVPAIVICITCSPPVSFFLTYFCAISALLAVTLLPFVYRNGHILARFFAVWQELEKRHCQVQKHHSKGNGFRAKISLLELSSVSLLLVPTLTANDQLFFHHIRSGQPYLETGFGFALLTPFLCIPVFCYLVARRFEHWHRLTIGKVVFLLYGYAIGFLCGLSLTIPAYLESSSGQRPIIPVNSVSSFQVSAAAFIQIPNKYGLLGLVTMLLVHILAFHRVVKTSAGSRKSWTPPLHG